jgi:hypothetical protein
VNAASTQAERPAVLVARGNFYLSREICEAYLAGVVTVALLARENDVLIVPLIPQSAGGLLLKQRNARGDRVIHAQEFFRSKGLPEEFELRTVSACWSRDAAALVVSGLIGPARESGLQAPAGARRT